jgi:ABC-type nitrate/sulfonate/bicarbonate transport system ATPase subunit
VGLEDHIDAYPHEVSMGMRQRTSLARALFSNTSLLLLDEPFNSLDLITKEEMYALLKKIREDFNITILLITHDFHDALFFSERILMLKEGTITSDWPVPKDSSAIEALKQNIRASFCTHPKQPCPHLD